MRRYNRFSRFIGIDYSGAATSDQGLNGLRVCEVIDEVPNPIVHNGNWSRNNLREWLRGQLLRGERTLVGIDHAFSLPQQSLQVCALNQWPAVLEFLGHRHPATTARYAHLDDDPRRAAAARISGEIAAALNGQLAGEVIPFQKP